MDRWFEHFKALLGKYIDNDSDHLVGGEDGDDNVNRPISREEVLLALRKIKSRKAAGSDRIIGELLGNACNHNKATH